MADDKTLDKLRSSIKFREEESTIGWTWHDAAGSPQEPLPMRGADLSFAELEGAVLLNVDLTDAVLVDAQLARANLVMTEMPGADLTRARLDRAHLHYANLQGARLDKANCRETDFANANLAGASLVGAALNDTNLAKANLEKADLQGAQLDRADLHGANLRGADLRGASLRYASLVEADFTDACLDGAKVYGVSCWGTILEGASQNNLVVTRPDEAYVTVDQLDVAQLIYLLLNHAGVRGVIEEISSRGVLILGRFGPRKNVLDAVRDALRELGYLPLLCDFDAPSSRDLTETVRILAGLSRFIIADLTEPRCIPHELASVVPDIAVPVRTIIEGEHTEYAMMADLNKYPWMIREPFRYRDLEDLVLRLPEDVIAVAEQRAETILAVR